MLNIEHNIVQLNSALEDYIRVGKKLPEEALAKQAGKFGFILSRELRAIMPAKGSLRAQGLALLKAGHGIRVRESVRRRVYEGRQVRQDIVSRQVVFGRGRRGARSVRRGKRRLNLQALAVQAELNVRERGRGFLSVSSRIPRFTRGLGDVQRSVSRFGPILGEAGLSVAGNGAEARFSWGPHGIASLAAARGLSRAKAREIIARSIDLTTEDILTYVRARAGRLQ